MVAVAAACFAITYQLDSKVAAGDMQTPGGRSPEARTPAREVLIGIAAAVITVAGVVFSITILALQLASQQFGPRMLRNFIRDRGTQISLGAFVATFVYSVLTLGSVAHRVGQLRAAHLGDGRVGPHARGSRRPDLLHPPRREVDPTDHRGFGHRSATSA